MQVHDLRRTRTIRFLTIAIALTLAAATASVLAESQDDTDDAENDLQVRDEIKFLEDNWHLSPSHLSNDSSERSDTRADDSRENDELNAWRDEIEFREANPYYSNVVQVENADSGGNPGPEQTRTRISFLEDNWHMGPDALFGDEAEFCENRGTVMWSNEARSHDH
jgi:hypothetical protein